jgi:hypothetical protein
MRRRPRGDGKETEKNEKGTQDVKSIEASCTWRVAGSSRK